MSRLRDIADLVMPVWIKRAVFDFVPQAQAKACEDQVECLVGKAFDWRETYAATMLLAKDFKFPDHYDQAIERREKALGGRGRMIREGLNNFLHASCKESFEDAVHDIMQPAVLITEIAALKQVRSVYEFLADPGKHAAHMDSLPAGSVLGTMVAGARTAMKDMNLLAEWESLFKNPASSPAPHTDGPDPAFQP